MMQSKYAPSQGVAKLQAIHLEMAFGLVLTRPLESGAGKGSLWFLGRWMQQCAVMSAEIVYATTGQRGHRIEPKVTDWTHRP